MPYAAGGPIDVTARALAERVKDSLGTVIIDNKPGAGGNIGADAVAKAAPDGLTIGIAATATNAVNPWLYGKMPFNAATDFAPITQMVRVPNVLVMNAEAAQRLKINTLADLIAYAKANPGKLNYGSGGNGSAGHLAGELFKKEAGIFALQYATEPSKTTKKKAYCCRTQADDRKTRPSTLPGPDLQADRAVSTTIPADQYAACNLPSATCTRQRRASSFRTRGHAPLAMLWESHRRSARSRTRASEFGGSGERRGRADATIGPRLCPLRPLG